VDGASLQPIHLGPQGGELATLAGEGEPTTWPIPIAALLVDKPAGARDLRHLSVLLRGGIQAEEVGLAVHGWRGQ
jgi:hypothetical protein